MEIKAHEVKHMLQSKVLTFIANSEQAAFKIPE